MKHIKPEQILVFLGVAAVGIYVLYSLAPKAPTSVSVGTPPVAGGSGVGQSGALGTAIGSLVNVLTGASATSANQQPTTTTPQPDFSL
jgi:hypothetical protein